MGGKERERERWTARESRTEDYLYMGGTSRRSDFLYKGTNMVSAVHCLHLIAELEIVQNLK